MEPYSHTNMLAFQAKFIPSAAQLTVMEENPKLIWTYRTITASLPLKAVRSEVHLTDGNSTFVADTDSTDLPKQMI